MEESAEEVLARLERYVESVRAKRLANPLFDPRAGVAAGPTGAPPPQSAGVDTLIPSRAPSRAPARVEPARPRPSLFSEVAPGMLAVVICTFVIVLSEWFDPMVAVVVGAALMLVGLVGLAQRVALAKPWLFGLIVAGLLIRFS